MLDIKFILNNLDAVKTALKNRNSDLSLDGIMAINDKRKDLQRRFDELRNLQNQKSKEIALAKKQGGDASQVLEDMQRVATQVKELSAEQTQIEKELEAILLVIPNVPQASVPVGADAESNQVLRTWGEIPKFDFKPREHWELGEALGLLDFDRAAKIAGARFALYRGALAKLERALIHFMLATHTESHGYEEILPPLLVNADSLKGTGQLPKFEDDLFKTTLGLYLIPTAEVPVTNIYRNETLSEKDLPKKFAAYTPCFRSEAGSYGKDVKGLIRQHQFNKVELVKITTKENSNAEHDSLTRDAEVILEKLKLPYRTVVLCTGDMGFGSAKTYDIEVWLPGQNAYREISSCSNFEDFQARRMNTRYKDQDGKMQFAHTINGSGLAVGRTLVAILENYQERDGSIIVPEVLRAFMGCERITS